MRRTRTKLLIGAVSVPLLGGLAVIALEGGASSASTVAPSARPTAAAFATAYVSFLNGRLAASGLPAATPRVRALAASGGRVPAAYRGRVLLRQVGFTGVRGATRASALVVARAGSRTPEAEFWLSYSDGRWRVSDLVPPDFSTLFAPPPPPVRVAPAMRAAAAAFAVAYADYRTGARHQLPDGLAAMRGQIAAGRDPLARTAHTGAAGHLISLQLLPQGQLSPADAVVLAGGHRLSFGFLLEATGRSWQVSGFPISQP